MTDGFHLFPGFISPAIQELLLKEVRAICREAPLVRPSMPNGTPMSVRVTNAGPKGWWSDANGGYRYVDNHPQTLKPWPKPPRTCMEVAKSATAAASLEAAPYDCVAINWYDDVAKLGMHVDRSERDRTMPIVSISLGDDAEFLMGGAERDDPHESYILSSGDVCVMAPPARNYFHSVKRIMPTMVSPLDGRGRINITVRKVT